MTTLYPDIKTKNWQISTAGVGVIAEGLADIRQCLDILLRTQKGSDPLRPEFGSDIFQYVDKPMNVAIPNVVKAIIEATAIWENRVTIHKIIYEIIAPGHIKFFITYKLVDEEIIDALLLYMNGGFVNYDPVDTAHLTLYALFPPNPFSKRYTISFTANGGSASPAPPVGGFATLSSLYSWVVANWSGYGTWVLGGDRITLFANSVITTGSLAISLTGVLVFTSPVPNLLVGQSYGVNFIPDGSAPFISPPSSFVSIGEMLTWLQTNWGSYGTWTIEGNPDHPADFYSPDFDPDDFDVSIPANYILVLYSETVNTCVLEVTIV